MKRFLTLILTVMLLVALLPASIVAQAESVTKEGFYLVNWDRNFDNDEYDYVYAMPYTWINTSKFDASTASIDIGVYFNGYSTSDIKEAAKELRDDFSKRPAGSRYINLAALATVFKHCAKDVIDMEDGVRLIADWLDRFLTEYKSIGGQLDGIAIDLEYNAYTSFYLQSNCCTLTSDGGEPKNLDILQDIVRNERVYQKIIRPQLVEYEKQGLFNFYTKDINPDTGLPDDLTTAIGPEYSSRVPIPVSEITTINRYDDNGGNAASRSTWSWVMSNYLMGCITRAAYDPMKKHYSDAILSDYSNGDTYSWHKSMSTSGGTTGTSVKAGNASNSVYYGTEFSEYFWASYSKSKTRQLYYKPASHNKAVFDPTDAFTRVLYDVNNQKRLLASARDKNGDDAIVNVWVPYFHYASTDKSYGNSAYFTEMMYHMGMTNPEPFLGYIIKSEVANKGKNYDDENMGDYYYALQISDEILSELTRVAGASDRKAIETPMDWNKGYILSGMYAGGRNIWRLTPDTTQVSVEDFKVNDYAPTFSVGGVTITFPQGRIVKDTKITQIGSCGYWIETPANVTPVVTTTADRYVNDPAFAETFSNYKEGAFAGSSTSMLTTTSGRPDTYWTVKGTAEIKENGDNKVLALSGDTTLTNAKIPENITAGDSYAKQQVWEVAVTLPDGNYGEVKIFGCHNLDGGIKISGGKVYYDQSGSYQELTGVTLASGTYTLKREVDFRTEGSCTSRYTIYDSTGNRLGGTEFVPMSAMTTAPVTNITVSTTGAAVAVELDNYKLYPTGVSAALDLYETSRGKKIDNPTAVRTEDTGYRLTWMNAGDTYQVARIYDAKSGTILKKIVMAPGMDGVVADVIKNSEGKEMQLALDVRDGAELVQPDYSKGNFAWTAVAESVGLAAGTKGNAGEDVLPPSGDGIGEEGDSIRDLDKSTEDTDNTDPTVGETNSADSATDPTENTNQNAPTDPNAKKGIPGGVIALIVILLLGGGAAVYMFVIKPKLAGKSAEDASEE